MAVMSNSKTLWTQIAIAVLPVLAVSALGGAVTTPNIAGWYAGLAKPVFNPPNWIFGPVWTLLYGMMVFALFRILRLPEATPGRAAAIGLFFAQLALNLTWSFAFFGARSPLLGLVVILPLLALIVLTIWRFRPLDRIASLLMWPYAAWVSFASLLNLSIWWLNP